MTLNVYPTRQRHFTFLVVFWDALPLLARFHNLQILHLCFDSSFTLQDYKQYSTKLRSRVLTTVFRILSGTFEKDSSKTANEAHASATTEIPLQGTLSSPISPSTLIIFNLGDYHDPELSNMPGFKAIMGGITALRLDIAQHKEMISRYLESTAARNQCQEMFTQLPFTWLSPTIATNLQVLSLCYQSYWGWFPNIDICLIGGGNGMPKLRSLALGRFVFSHLREVDWIASLDLEELFLEGCAVLAKHHGHPATRGGL
ncbi:f-box domain protein [Fusarium beomiforme]|uniref:F-box domain protein n=1 Tax=Fusarium beomiforme TaxID=44412 RepID=A0A9P5ATW4_9HYPO|nr:f-box domain protein [Fusarium beomiforme]